MSTTIPISRRKPLSFFLIALALWTFVCTAASAETTLAEAAVQFSRALSDMRSSTSWGQSMARQDLEHLGEAVAAISRFAETEGPYTLADLKRLRENLVAALHHARSSAALSEAPEKTAELLQLAADIDRRLVSATRLFEGKALPSRQALANQEGFGLPYFESPQDLIREARSVRYSAIRLQRPWGGSLGFGWASGGASGYGLRELTELMDAASDFETVCDVGYAHVGETRKAFERLRRAYDRVQSLRYGSPDLNWNSLDRSLLRLERFYGSLL